MHSHLHSNSHSAVGARAQAAPRTGLRRRQAREIRTQQKARKAQKLRTMKQNCHRDFRKPRKVRKAQKMHWAFLQMPHRRPGVRRIQKALRVDRKKRTAHSLRPV